MTETGWIEPEILKRLTEEGTTIHRVYSGYEGWVERFGEDYLLCTKGEEEIRSWPERIRAWGEEQGLLVERVFWKKLQQNQSESAQYELLTGQSHASIRTRC